MQELKALRERIELEIDARSRADERALRQRGGMVERDGPRYRNPENSAETWSGKGLQPAWVAEARASGLRLADLEIVDDRPMPGTQKKKRRESR